ncbi:MAG: GTP-binding protein, partial [Candidatus Aenigmatarchaeota archaeon]
MAKKEMTERVMECMKDPTRIRNVATSSHVHHGKTTLTDNLMAGAGMLAEEMAGKVMYTWFDPEERKRQLTVYGANV